MKFTEIYYLERKNKGNYEHEECSAKALIDENEDPIAAMVSLKDSVHNALYGILNKPIIKEEVSEVKPAAEAVNAATVEEVKKDRKPRSPNKPKATEVEASSEVVPEATPVVEKDKFENCVPYNRGLDTHKQMLSLYLSNNFPGWKSSHPKQEIIDFNASLHGNMFLHENGEILEAFKKTLAGFYGA